MIQVDTSLQDEIRAMNMIAQRVADAEAVLQDIKLMYLDAEQRVIDKFVDTETQDITVDGVRYKPHTTTIIGPATGCAEYVTEWIINNGGEDLVKPAMHHKTRNAFLRESFVAEDGSVTLPDELEGKIAVFEKTTVSKRGVA